MKKISKLALLVAASVSFVCFVFYKYQYDKLYNVLQVLEFFGSPETPDSSGKGRKTGNLRYGFGSSGRPSAWKLLDPNRSVYGAYCGRNGLESSSSCAEVLAVATVAGSTSSMGCKIWYVGKVHPEEGVFASSPLNPASPGGEEGRQRGDPVPYLFTCESKFADLVPDGVTFYTDDGKEVYVSTDADMIGVGKEAEVVVCFGPDDPTAAGAGRPMTSSLLAEQILLQNHFGVNYFVVYDAGVPSGFLEAIRKRQQASPDSSKPLHVSIQPWNAPVSSALAMADCHLRTRDRFESYVYLEAGQVVVPLTSSERTVGRVIKDTSALSLSQGRRTGGKYNLVVRKFCSEYPSAKAGAASNRTVDDEPDYFPQTVNLLRRTTYSSKRSLAAAKVPLFHKLAPDRNQEVAVDERTATVFDFRDCGIDLDDVDPDKEHDDAMEDVTLLRLAKVIEGSIAKYLTTSD